MLLCHNLMQKEEVTDQILKGLQILLKLEPKVGQANADIIALGVCKILESNSSKIMGTGWQIGLSLLELAAKQSAFPVGLNTLKAIISSENVVTSTNYSACCSTLLAYARSQAGDSKLSIQAMELKLSLLTYIPALDQSSNQLTGTESWSLYWLPVLKGFCVLCVDSRQDVRNHAMAFLQRALLSPNTASLNPNTWRLCFELVLFPLLTDMLQPMAIQIDARELEEIRGRAAGMLSKIFLQYVKPLSSLSEFPQIWLKVLQYVQMYTKTNSEILADTVLESLKNMILVISKAGIFDKELWDLTWVTLEATMKKDLLSKVEPFLPESNLPPKTTPIRTSNNATVTTTNSSSASVSPPASSSTPKTSRAVTSSIVSNTQPQPKDNTSTSPLRPSLLTV